MRRLRVAGRKNSKQNKMEDADSGQPKAKKKKTEKGNEKRWWYGTVLLATPSVRGKKDAIVSKFCGLSCGELINEAAFQVDVRLMIKWKFNSMLV